MFHPGRPRPSTAAVVVALLIVYVVWGSTYLGHRGDDRDHAAAAGGRRPLRQRGSDYADGARRPRSMAATQRAGRASDLGALALRLHHRALLLLGGNGGVVLGEMFIPSGIAAVLVAMDAIWLAVFDAAVTRRRPSGLVIGGLIGGIAGVAVLLVPVEGLDGLDPLGVALVVGAGISWAAGSLYVRHAPLPRSGLLATGLEMVAGGVLSSQRGACSARSGAPT